jgi:hypothetical protein
MEAPVVPEIPVSRLKRHIRPNGVSIDQLDLSSLMSCSGSIEVDNSNLPHSDAPLNPLKLALLNQNISDSESMSPAHYKHMMRCRASKGL